MRQNPRSHTVNSASSVGEDTRLHEELNTDNRSYYALINKGHARLINDEVDRMLVEDIIRPSCNPWSSPIRMTEKRDRKPLFCIDFRLINAVSIKEVFSLLLINNILNRLREENLFSTLDIRYLLAATIIQRKQSDHRIFHSQQEVI